METSPELLPWALDSQHLVTVNTSSHSVAPPSVQLSHWSGFPQVPYIAHVIVGVIVGIIGVVAVLGNAVVIYIFLRYKSLRTSGNILVVNLALSDLLMAGSNCPLFAAASFHGRWPFPDAVCKFYGFTGALFGLMSINSLTAIALDRFLVITQWHRVRGQLTFQQVKVILFIVWLNSLVWAVAPLLQWNNYVLEGFGTSCTFDYITKTEGNTAFIVSMYTCAFGIPVSLIIVFYSYIFWTVHTHEQTFRHTAKRLKCKKIKGSGQSSWNTEIRISRTILITILMFCLAWTPYAVLALIGHFGNANLITPYTSLVPGLLAKTSTVYNPVIYFFSHPRFRCRLQIAFKALTRGRLNNYLQRESSYSPTAIALKSLNDCCPPAAELDTRDSSFQSCYKKMMRVRPKHLTPLVTCPREESFPVESTSDITNTESGSSDQPVNAETADSCLLSKDAPAGESRLNLSRMCARYSCKSHLSSVPDSGIPKSFSTGSFYILDQTNKERTCHNLASIDLDCLVTSNIKTPIGSRHCKRHSCGSDGDYRDLVIPDRTYCICKDWTPSSKLIKPVNTKLSKEDICPEHPVMVHLHNASGASTGVGMCTGNC